MASERFFEMSMVLFMMSFVINVLLVTASEPITGGLGLPPLILQSSDNNNLYTQIGLNEAIQDINISQDENSVQGRSDLPVNPATDLLAYVNSLVIISQILIQTPLMWQNIGVALGDMADPDRGPIFSLFQIIGSLISIINIVGMSFIILRLLTVVRGVIARSS